MNYLKLLCRDIRFFFGGPHPRLDSKPVDKTYICPVCKGKGHITLSEYPIGILVPTNKEDICKK